MLDEWIRSMKEKKEDGWGSIKGRKSKYLLVVMICLGLLALIWPVTRTGTTSAPAVTTEKSQVAVAETQERLSAELESILSQIAGAGKVSVSVTLVSDGVKVYATNERDEKRDIEEKDGKTTTKLTSENNIQHDLAVSSGSPLMVEDKLPEILGVLVVAAGAKNAAVQEELTKATATLLNISSYKVRVVAREGEI